jgi:hypothetical protein
VQKLMQMQKERMKHQYLQKRSSQVHPWWTRGWALSKAVCETKQWEKRRNTGKGPADTKAS